MDWTRVIEEERAALMRIVALVLALADLAELACTGSPAARGFVLWILHWAETVVREFVDAPANAMPTRDGRSGDVRADLIHLAARLRALAAEVEREARSNVSCRDGDAAPAEPFPFQSGRISRIIAAVQAVDFPAVPAPDTS